RRRARSIGRWDNRGQGRCADRDRGRVPQAEQALPVRCKAAAGRAINPAAEWPSCWDDTNPFVILPVATADGTARICWCSHRKRPGSIDLPLPGLPAAALVAVGYLDMRAATLGKKRQWQPASIQLRRIR